MLLPTACPVCGRPGPAPCRGCAELVVRAGPAPAPRGLVWCRSLLVFEGPGRELVARLKYRNARASIRWLAAGMAELVGSTAGEIGLVTWAPTTPQRRRQRGFDQAELLARSVSRQLGLECRRALRRQPGPHQTGRSMVERRQGVRFRPVTSGAAAAAIEIRPKVLLIDDVVTTGSSLSAAASALAELAPVQVFGLTAARTP